MNQPSTYIDWPYVTMYGIDCRAKLHNLYVLITRLNLWNILKIMDVCEQQNTLFQELHKLSGIDSNCMFIQLLKSMKYIANNDYESYCKIVS